MGTVWVSRAIRFDCGAGMWLWRAIYLLVGWVGIATMPVRNMLSEGVKLLESSCTFTHTASDMEVQLVSMKKLNVLQIVCGCVERKVVSSFDRAKFAH